MAPPQTVYPRSKADCLRLLATLGFVKRRGIGRGKHPEKYYHPTRRNIRQGDKPFILITHEYYDELGMKIMRKLQNWDFTKAEIEAACSGIKPTDKDVAGEIDIEPEEA